MSRSNRLLLLESLSMNAAHWLLEGGAVAASKLQRLSRKVLL